MLDIRRPIKRFTSGRFGNIDRFKNIPNMKVAEKHWNSLQFISSRHGVQLHGLLFLESPGCDGGNDFLKRSENVVISQACIKQAQPKLFH